MKIGESLTPKVFLDVPSVGSLSAPVMTSSKMGILLTTIVVGVDINFHLRSHYSKERR